MGDNHPHFYFPFNFTFILTVFEVHYVSSYCNRCFIECFDDDDDDYGKMIQETKLYMAKYKIYGLIIGFMFHVFFYMSQTKLASLHHLLFIGPKQYATAIFDHNDFLETSCGVLVRW